MYWCELCLCLCVKNDPLYERLRRKMYNVTQRVKRTITFRTVSFFSHLIFTVTVHRRYKMILMCSICLSRDTVLNRCFSDVKTAVWISGATGRTIGLDLEISVENSGSVSLVCHQLPRTFCNCL